MSPGTATAWIAGGAVGLLVLWIIYETIRGFLLVKHLERRQAADYERYRDRVTQLQDVIAGNIQPIISPGVILPDATEHVMTGAQVERSREVHRTNQEILAAHRALDDIILTLQNGGRITHEQRTQVTGALRRAGAQEQEVSAFGISLEEADRVVVQGMVMTAGNNFTNMRIEDNGQHSIALGDNRHLSVNIIGHENVTGVTFEGRPLNPPGGLSPALPMVRPVRVMSLQASVRTFSLPPRRLDTRFQNRRPVPGSQYEPAEGPIDWAVTAFFNAVNRFGWGSINWALTKFGKQPVTIYCLFPHPKPKRQKPMPRRGRKRVIRDR